MKLKAGIRYQTVELVQCTAVFCLIIGAVIGALLLCGLSLGASGVMPGMGGLPYAVMFMLALSVFSGDARFLLQMGLTRAQMLASTAASFAVACLFLALVEVACAALISFWPHVQSLFLMAYGPERGLLLDFAFMFLGCAAASAVGLALAAVQMRVGSKRFLLGAGGVFLATLALLSALPSAMSFFKSVSWAFGFGEGASLANPFILFAVVVALGAVIAWTVSRRLEVR